MMSSAKWSSVNRLSARFIADINNRTKSGLRNVRSTQRLAFKVFFVAQALNVANALYPRSAFLANGSSNAKSQAAMPTRRSYRDLFHGPCPAKTRGSRDNNLIVPGIPQRS
jgi:hypothetical protein